jgi:hypothetical protein
MKHRQRGQALVELAISLPLILLALAMLFWTAKYAVLSERLEADARYSQQILSSQNLYTQYSVAALYDVAAYPGGPVIWPAKATCPPPPINFIEGPIIATDNGVHVPRLPMWEGKGTQNECGSGHKAITATSYTHNFLLGYQTSQIATNLVPLFPLSMIGTLPLNSHGPSMYKAASLADVTMCLGGISVVAPSLADGSKYTNGEEDGNKAVVTQDGPPASANAAPTLNPSCTGTALNPVPNYTGKPYAVTPETATYPGPWAVNTSIPSNYGSLTVPGLNVWSPPQPSGPGPPGTITDVPDAPNPPAGCGGCNNSS